MNAVMAERPRISPTVVDEFIRLWRRARTSSDQGKLDYPHINILHAAYYPAGESDHEPQDDPAADTVQKIVEIMPFDIRTSFESWHLGIIRGEWCRDRPQRWRALVLGLQFRIYEARERTGWAIVREHLSLTD